MDKQQKGETTRLERIYKTCRRRKMFQDVSETIQIGLATTISQLEEAYKLVHKAFVGKGYIPAQRNGIRIRTYEALPEMCTFAAKQNNATIAVQSIIKDSKDFGLPSEHPSYDKRNPSEGPFQKEIDSLREKGRKVSEATNEAIRENNRNTRNGIPTELMRCCLAHAKHYGFNSIVAAVSPGHLPLYKLMTFEQIGDEKPYCSKTGDKAILVHLKVDELDEMAELAIKSRGENGLLPGIHNWFCIENPHGKLIISSKEQKSALYSNTTALEEFFFEKGNLREQLSPEQLQAIRDKWREAAIGQVAHELSVA